MPDPPSREEPLPDPTEGDSGSLRLARILVAEDSPENQQVATRVLESDGARVDIAVDGRAAVQMAAQVRYDLILMDLQMPALDGVQATTAIRAAERAAGDEPVPIVAFTAFTEAAWREQCLAAGMNDYVVKPTTSRELLETVRRWADRRPVLLVADDAPEIRRLIKRRLGASYRIVQAVDGQDALARFARQPVALVLLDMNMPVLDGYATAAAIRARDDGRQVPIIAMTGSEEEEARDRANRAGCTMHLTKPLSLTTLTSAVDAALRLSTPERVVQAHRAEPAEGSAAVALAIDPALADLVPGYVREKRRQLDELRRLIASHDLDRVRRIAHDIKGTGAAYGIPDVSRLGRELEVAAQQGNARQAALLVDALDAVLAAVQAQLGG